MILRKIVLFVFFFFCISSGIFAQFNTVRFEVPIEAKDTIIEQVEVKVEKKDPQKISWFKRLFKREKKENLKQEIDSLKILIIEQEKSYKKNISNIETYLQQIIRNDISKNTKNEKKESDKNIQKIYTPLKMMFVTSAFGRRMHPIDKQIKMHNGIDLKANYERVYSIMDGEVIDTGFDKNGGGKYIKISHANRFETVYLHLSEVYYKKGEKVGAGFIIAKSGNTGKSTNPHLHFAVKENGKYINPMKFLNQIIEINNIIKFNKNGRK